jgi:predicted RNA-binding Zn-ribbon protein involved in translation (DUF1610 family)
MATPTPPQPSQQPSELRRRRERLAEEVAELQWALGGLTYEMAIRDHFRLDVLLRRAAMLQERDAELAEVDRLLHMQESSVAGSCPACGAVRSRGAVYCWQCGAAMMERSPVVSDAVTTELNTAVSREDRVPLPPVAAPRVISPEQVLSAESEQTLPDVRRGAEPSARGEHDAFGRPVSIGR